MSDEHCLVPPKSRQTILMVPLADLEAAVREREDYNGKHQGACLEIERLRKALAEIVIRTMPYQDDHEGWPLVAGVHRVAHDALASSSQ